MMLPLPDWQPGVKSGRGADVPASVLQYGLEYSALVYHNRHNGKWRADLNGECVDDVYPTETEAKVAVERLVNDRVVLRLYHSVEFVWQYSPVSDTLIERLRIHGLTGPRHGLPLEMGNLLLEAANALLLLGQPAQPEEPVA